MIVQLFSRKKMIKKAKSGQNRVASPHWQQVEVQHHHN